MPKETTNWLAKISDTTKGIVTFPLFESGQENQEVNEKEVGIKERRDRENKFAEKINSTLQAADQINLANLRYFNGGNLLISLGLDLRELKDVPGNFSKSITTEEAVKNFADRCEQQRLEYVRKMYREMLAYEFWHRLESRGIKEVYDAMGFPDAEKAKGYYREDPIFFAECRPLIESAARVAAQKYGLQKSAKKISLLAKKIFWRESRGDPLAASRTWHVGLAQLSPALYDGTDFNYSRKINPFNPEEAIPRGVDYIASHFKSFGGDGEKTKQAYNAGRWAVLNSRKKPLSKEAREYPQNVKEDYARFLALLESNPEAF
ncbi:lytic transglycosylase domain-containing protein [Patescibacteria group bacterium]|nr:lytic transglycosylase domain-containing protein [Patescibacteria group bacterium]